MTAGTDGLIPPVLLVGCGRMGGAMLAGWRERGLAPSVVVDPAAPAAGAAVTFVADAAAVPEGFAPDAVVLAVKPQNAEAVVPAYAMYARDAVVLTIMAGPTIARVKALLGGGAAVVRAMPNTPASIRQAITIACGQAAPAQLALCETLLSSIGEVAWVADEGLIDAVTAVSGGGPAYVFLLAELLEQAAAEQGIPADLARRMARRTVAGAGALLAASDEDAAALRRAVTSPKGTTERALAVLMADDAWPALVRRAVAEAAERSRELAR